MQWGRFVWKWFFRPMSSLGRIVCSVASFSANKQQGKFPGNQTTITMKLHAKARFARLWIVLLFTSLSMVSVLTVSFAVSIGNRCQGGIVFYVDEFHQHGLVAATRDLPGMYEWQGAKVFCLNWKWINASVELAS
jgi:hypothetical protein